MDIKGKSPQGLPGAFPAQGHWPSVGGIFQGVFPSPQSASLTREETFSLMRSFKTETECLVTTYYVPMLTLCLLCSQQSCGLQMALSSLLGLVEAPRDIKCPSR